LQVKLCDPRLSALSVPWCKKALYKYSSFPFLLPYTEQSSRPVSELSSVDPNVYVLVYALLVGHARKEKEV